MSGRDNIQRDRPSMTRVIGYKFSSDVDLEGETCDLLNHELEIEGTQVTQYGTDGLFLWMNGAPGPKLREVVKKLKTLGWKSMRWIND